MAFEGEDARRWSITEAPTLQPAVDFITKSPNGPFIDTGVNITFEMRGRMYLSVDTIREMAEISGLLETKNAQEKSLHDLEIYNQGYEAGLKEGAELLGKLTTAVERLSAVDSVADVSGAETVADDAAVESVESGKPASDSDNVQGASAGSRKSGGKARAARSVGGPDDVSSVSDGDERFRI